MKKVLIINNIQVQQKINRIAYQILEDNFDEKEIIIAGVWSRGFRLALRLKNILEQISSIKITIASISLNKEIPYDDSSADISNIDFENKVVVLVDDVLNSGRTLALGVGVFLKSPIKKLRTAVLIDRSHKRYPIATDFVGLELSTVLKEHVEVVLDENNEQDAVYLI
jgi:pyrimidine operon attenuation protein/uracil phosphoribosyltransferase